MSIDKHFEKKGIALTEDNSLPSGQRTQKNVKRVIAAVRAAEAEFNEALHQANERCREAQEQRAILMEKLARCEAENMRLKLDRTLQEPEFEPLTTSSRERLLGLAAV